MSKDFDTEEDLHFFAQPYLFEHEYMDGPDNTSAVSLNVACVWFRSHSV